VLDAMPHERIDHGVHNRCERRLPASPPTLTRMYGPAVQGPRHPPAACQWVQTMNRSHNPMHTPQ
jgi:hypothetical protein